MKTRPCHPLCICLRNFVLAGIALLALARCPPGLAQPTNFAKSLPELRAQLDAHLDQPRFKGALWGVKIVSLKTGRLVYENHPDRLMSPASNSKLYVGALALDTLGGDYKFMTPLLAAAKPDKAGVLRGDLIVSGCGDPGWKAQNFDALFAPFVTAVTNAGVRRITGDLVADTTFFHGPPTGGSWCVEDLDDSEGAGICALTLDDNVAQIRVTPGTNVSDTCRLVLAPSDTGITLVNRTRTISAGREGHLELHIPPGTATVYVFGDMPAGSKGETLDVPVPQPAAWFGAGLKDALARSGVPVWGKVRTVCWPEIPSWNKTSLVKLGEVKSPPLSEIIRAFMKPSQNLEADLVFDHIGETLRPANAPVWLTSEQSAVAALERFAAENGLPADVHFDEGSGLSRNNLTSANATVALLTLMATNRWAEDFLQALPVAGVDGTLRWRMKGTPAYQNVRAKTGTLRWANSLSGYVTTAAGERLVFSLFLNRYDSPPGRRRSLELDDIAVLLAGFAGRTDE
jgi:serine-type D-Ala-D-Ala carboxypeptidase/endopeptidase (penicillin-binding protein 4)